MSRYIQTVLPDTEHRELKVLAIEKGISLQKLTQEVLLHYLKQQKEQQLKTKGI